MGRDIAIAQIEPGLAEEAAERIEGMETLVREAPTVGAIHDAAERVDDRVNVGRDVQSVKLLVVSRVDDDVQQPRVEAADQPADKLSGPHPPRKRGYRGS